MQTMTRLAAALLTLSLLLAPAYAAGVKASPTGSWQSSDGQARVRVTMCGDGTALCARLTAVSGEARTPENLQLLNHYVVDRAQPADAGTWQGTMHFNGQTADGHITMVSANTVKVSACEMGMCKTIEFHRVGSTAPIVAEAPASVLARNVGFTVPE
jgi:hypothetical protein